VARLYSCNVAPWQPSREGGAGAVDNAPIEAPQRSTASATQFYALNDEKNMQRKSYRVGSVTAGDYNDDSRYAEWQWVNGAIVPCRVSAAPNLSELFSAYAITLNADRASSAASNHALQLAATDLEYEVTRVKSPVLGRDLNPMGRGDGTYYCNGGNFVPGGSLAVGGVKPGAMGLKAGGYGNSIGNSSEEGPVAATDTSCESTKERIKKRIEELMQERKDLEESNKVIEERIQLLLDQLDRYKEQKQRAYEKYLQLISYLQDWLVVCLAACALLFFAPIAMLLCIFACVAAYFAAKRKIDARWYEVSYGYDMDIARTKADIMHLRFQLAENLWRIGEINEELKKLGDELAEAEAKCKVSGKPVEPEPQVDRPLVLALPEVRLPPSGAEARCTCDIMRCA